MSKRQAKLSNDWASVETDTQEQHIVPVDDLHEHILCGECWCSPDQQIDGIFSHNSADQRELYESGERKTH